MGCDLNKAGTYSFSYRLVKLVSTETSRFLHVKAYAVEGLIGDARKLLSEYKDTLNQVRVKTLESFISLKENNMREKERREKEKKEKEKNERERQNQQRSQRQGVTGTLRYQ